MLVQIILFDGFDELDAIAPYEVFKNAASAGGTIDARLVTLDQPCSVTASHGLCVQSQAALTLQPPPSVLLVPGGNWNSQAATGVRQEVAAGSIPQAIAAHHAAGVQLAAVCTGAMLLAAAGVLHGRPATTHHAAVDDLQAAGAKIVAARVVDDGDIMTAGGVTSGLDLAFWIVQRHCGATIADEIARRMEYTRQGSVWQR